MKVWGSWLVGKTEFDSPTASVAAEHRVELCAPTDAGPIQAEPLRGGLAERGLLARAARWVRDAMSGAPSRAGNPTNAVEGDELEARIEALRRNGYFSRYY